MQDKEIIQNFEKKDIIFKTRKIQFKARIYPSNFLQDILETYNKNFPPIDIQTLFHALQNSSNNGTIKIQNVVYEIYVNNDNLERSIISKRTGINMPYKEILNSGPNNIFKSPYDADNKEALKSSNDNINSDNSSTKRYRIDDGEEKQTKFNLNNYKNLIVDDESSDILVKKKDNFETAFNKKVNISDKFGENKSSIVRAFNNCAVISTDSFISAFCAVNGRMFNYKTDKCGIPHKSHPSLSGYLRCCSSIVEILDYKKQYVVSKDLTIPGRRFDYYSKLVKGHALFKLSFEALCCNIFPTKCTVFLDDFYELFNYVYKMPLIDYINAVSNNQIEGRKIIDYINNLKIPNFIITQKNNVYSIIVTPLGTPEYREWESALLHKKIREIENSFITIVKVETGVSQTTINMFKPSSNYLELLKIADLNLPKCILRELPGREFADGEVEHNDFWIYLKENVNFDSKRVFF